MRCDRTFTPSMRSALSNRQPHSFPQPPTSDAMPHSPIMAQSHWIKRDSFQRTRMLSGDRLSQTVSADSYWGKLVLELGGDRPDSRNRRVITAQWQRVHKPKEWGESQCDQIQLL
ncbi:MAG: hypothetical protein ACRCU2_13075 [Planktothrix sp.]